MPELLVAMTIIAVAAAMAIPAFHRLIIRQKLVAVTYQLAGSLRAARMDSVTKDTPVTFCAGSTRVGRTADWNANEWIVFSDRNHNAVIDGNDRVLRATRLNDDIDLTLDGNGPFRKAVVFQPIGIPERVSGAFAAGRLRICARSEISENATDLIMSATGRLRAVQHDFGGTCPAL